MGRITFLLIALFQMSTPTPQSARDPGLEALADEFFAWRAVQQPASGDDIPRVERPDGWVPDYSPVALTQYRSGYADFLFRLSSLDSSNWTVADHVDARSLRSAIDRVHWELDVLRSPYRNPIFYVDQTLGSVFELLIISSPMNDQRAENILLRLESFPSTIKSAQTNLNSMVRPFAKTAIASLVGIDQRLSIMETGLQPVFPEPLHGRLARAVRTASQSLEDYSQWLAATDPLMSDEFSIGPDAYQYFLSHIALIPHTPDELLAQGRQEWDRAVVADVLERNRNIDVDELPLFDTVDAQVDRSREMESEIRVFLEQQQLMTIPPSLKHYLNRPMPPWLVPLAFMGVTDDLTSATRLDENAVSYIWAPTPDLGYFDLASAKDPRPIIIHEGVPGHYFQMALSWRNPDPIRRHYFDSGANEGIGFWVEEMLLQAGLFDESPKTREIIYSFMRLRALRVEVDIRLATGDFTIEQAAQYLAQTVPMDMETAHEEAVFFASTPGQAITYQIGKLQILGFLADAKMQKAQDFSLREFNDYLMENGNVPISLLRWEYLGLNDEINRIDVQALESATRLLQ